MGLRAKGEATGTVHQFIPDIEDNTKDPSPTTIHIKVPTKKMWRELVSHSVDGGAGLVVTLHQTIRDCVVKVDSYDDASGCAVTDAEGLVEHGADALLNSIFDKVRELATMSVQEKN